MLGGGLHCTGPPHRQEGGAFRQICGVHKAKVTCCKPPQCRMRFAVSPVNLMLAAESLGARGLGWILSSARAHLGGAQRVALGRKHLVLLLGPLP